MTFPMDPKEGQSYRPEPLTTVQRHAVKDAGNKLRSVGLSREALYLDGLLEMPMTWTFSKGAWRADSFEGAESDVADRKKTAVKTKKRPAAAA